MKAEVDAEKAEAAAKSSEKAEAFRELLQEVPSIPFHPTCSVADVFTVEGGRIGNEP